MELDPQNLNRLRWLLDMRNRRRDRHPETVHPATLELPLNNLQRAELEAMAALLGLEPAALVLRYLASGLDADLDALLRTHGPRVGLAPGKRHPPVDRTAPGIPVAEVRLGELAGRSGEEAEAFLRELRHGGGR